jgi:hypothetical protein
MGSISPQLKNNRLGQFTYFSATRRTCGGHLKATNVMRDAKQRLQEKLDDHERQRVKERRFFALISQPTLIWVGLGLTYVFLRGADSLDYAFLSMFFALVALSISLAWHHS